MSGIKSEILEKISILIKKWCLGQTIHFVELLEFLLKNLNQSRELCIQKISSTYNNTRTTTQ